MELWGPYQWPYKWITVFVFTPISGVITLLITGISIGAHFVTNSSNHSASSESPEDIFFCFLALGDKSPHGCPYNNLKNSLKLHSPSLSKEKVTIYL